MSVSGLVLFEYSLWGNGGLFNDADQRDLGPPVDVILVPAQYECHGVDDVELDPPGDGAGARGNLQRRKKNFKKGL